MKGTIKDILNIPGVQGYIIASNSNIQVKLPSKFTLKDTKDRISQLLKILSSGKGNTRELIEIFADEIAIVVFCSAMPVLIVVTNNISNLPVIRITGKLVYANIVKGA